MNIMIAGCGRIGKAIAGQLCEEKHEITMMDIHQDALTSATNSMDVIGYYGDCTSYRAQLEAGVEDADLMIAVTNQDEKNMLACLESEVPSTHRRSVIFGRNWVFLWPLTRNLSLRQKLYV